MNKKKKTHENSKEAKRDHIALRTAQCNQCFKWRRIETEEEYEQLRSKSIEEPFTCNMKPNVSCDDPADLDYDTTRTWVSDKPNIPITPQGFKRNLILRSDHSRFDVHYVTPDGTKIACYAQVSRCLQKHPELNHLKLEDFSFALPALPGIMEDTPIPQEPKHHYIDLHVAQCIKCEKWRTIETEEEYEQLRSKSIQEPFTCDMKPNVSCDDPPDLDYDATRTWVFDKPNIPPTPQGFKRNVTLRSNHSRLDVHYVTPDGQKVTCHAQVSRYLQKHPELNHLKLEDFNFDLPKRQFRKK